MTGGNTRMQWYAATAASMGYLANGMISSWVTPVLPRLEAPGSSIPITNDQGSWIVSTGTLTMLVSILMVPYTVDVIGRKKLLVATALPFLSSWLFVIFADSFGMLLASRIVASLGGGVLITVGPMYLSEVADSDIRGAVVMMHSILSNLGTLLIISIAPYTSITVSSLLSMLAALVYFGMILWVPQSPYFLLKRGREEDATKALMKLRGLKNSSDLKVEMEIMKKAIQLKEITKGKFKDLFCQRVHRRTFLMMAGLYILQMSSGASTIMAYSTTIFEMSGSSFDSNVSSIIVAAVQVIMVTVCSTLVDRVGRRPLMIVTFFVCGIMMAIEGTYFLFVDIYGEVPSQFDWVPLTALIALQISFWLGYGPVLATVVGEIYHVSVKGLAASAISVIVSVYGFFLQKMFQVVCDNLGPHYAFLTFAVLCVIGGIYAFVMLPETKGKTFAEINDEMDRRAGRSPVDVEVASKIAN